MTPEEQFNRQALAQARRIVIKLGTRLLVRSDGRLNTRRLKELAGVLAGLVDSGKEVVLVSSGAIGAGVEALGLKARPKDLADLQMAAAVGQARLMTRYQQLFAEHGCRIGQVLLTHDDLKNRTRHLNARNTLMNLLRNRILPIVNENDVVSVEEIQVGDNDQLASLVAILVDADALLLMTSVRGLLQPRADGRQERIPWLPWVSATASALAGDKGSPLSTGGMRTKLKAADAAQQIGALAVIADGRKPENIVRILRGEAVGTLIGDKSKGASRIQNKRKQWIAFFHRGKGTLIVDAGARKMLMAQGKSLLPIGVRDVSGQFQEGEVVDIALEDGGVFAQGISEHDAETIRRIKGLKSAEVGPTLGKLVSGVVVHRDNLAIRDDHEESR